MLLNIGVNAIYSVLTLTDIVVFSLDYTFFLTSDWTGIWRIGKS